MKSSKLNRRKFLRGVAGGALVTVGLPAFEMFLNNSGTAYAAGDLFPKRFGLFFWGNGVIPTRWNPAATGPGWTVSEQLAPLAGLEHLITVVSGMAIKIENNEPHTAGAAGILSGAPLFLEGDHRSFSMPSIDQVIANIIGTNSRFKSLEFGAAPGKGQSYNAQDNMNPPETSPKALFDRVFGGGFRLPDESGEPDPRLGLRLSVLDAVVEDANRLHARLGANDRARLDQHLTGIRELENRIDYMEKNPPSFESCALPAVPADNYPDVDGRKQLSAINRAMVDVAAMALACDQTRVFSNFFTYSVSNLLFPGSNSGHHQLTHDEGGDQPEVNKIVIQIMAEYAYLVEQLRAVPEGAGTLLDSCCIMGTTDSSLGRTHGMTDFPIVLAGSAGGYLKQGIHYRSPSFENASRVLLSIVRSMDPDNPIGEFGAGEGHVTESQGDIEV